VENERELLTIGALLHDVGKIALVQDVQSQFKEILAPFERFMSGHRDKSMDDSDPLTWYVALADKLSSSETQFSKEEDFDELRSLENILARVNRDEKDTKVNYFKPSVIPDVDMPTYEKSASKDDYKKIYEGLVQELKSMPFSVETVRFLLYKYLSFVPQSAQKSGFMDVSLYDHLRITAMIALCIYDYVKTNGSKVERYQDLENLQTEPVLLLVQGDVSGIQKFIKNVSSKGALRSFRGRSIFIDLFQEIVVEKILEETGFYRTNVHFIGGGHFYLILSNTQQNIEKLEKVRNLVNEWLLNKTQEMKLIIGYEPMRPIDLKDPSEKFERLGEQIREKKLRMHSEQELRKIFELPVTTKRSHSTCKVCGKREENLYPLREDEDPIACEFCKQMYDLGRLIMRSKYFSQDAYGDFEILGERYSFCDQPGQGKNYVLGIQKVNTASTAQYVFTDIVSYAKHEEFQELAEESTARRLACLQADIDHLGEIFKEGLKVKTLSRMSTLSRLLTYFFKYRVRKLIEGKNVVLGYSGGDDLFILGGWEDILQFAYEMQMEFRRFTGNNEKITYTASFVVFNEKESISKVKEIADQAEGYGKKSGRNCLVLSHGIRKKFENRRAILEKTQHVSWEEFTQKTYKIYEELSRLANSVDRSVIRKALELSLEDSPLNKAFLAYIEARENDQDRDFANLIRTNEVPALNAVLQLIDLKARGRYENG